MRPKYQIFISSTYGDLREPREAVTWALLKARHIPVGMEAFTATDDRGWQTIKSSIDRTDYYILIVAGKYGSTDSDGKSWTEKEYEYATSKGIPTLVFIRSKSSITADNIEESTPSQRKLAAFVAMLRSKHLCAEWNQQEDLVSQVTSSLSNHILDDEDSGNGRPGWYRGDEIPSGATLEEFARLSSEVSILREENRKLHVAGDAQPSLELCDMFNVPVVGYCETKRKLFSFREHRYTDEYNAAVTAGVSNHVIFRPAVRNTGKALVEHIVVDMTFDAISGFVCRRWRGVDFINNVELSRSEVELSCRDWFPESVRRLSSNRITFRFRLNRVCVGAMEFLPPILIVGSPIEQELPSAKSSFSMEFRLTGSVGVPVSGKCSYVVLRDPEDLMEKSEAQLVAKDVEKEFGQLSWHEVFLD